MKWWFKSRLRRQWEANDLRKGRAEKREEEGAKTRPRSQLFVDRAPMCDRVKRDQPGGMINPKEHAVVADSVFLKSLQIGRHVLQWVREQLRMDSKPVNLPQNSLCDSSLKRLQVTLEGRGGLDGVGSFHFVARRPEGVTFRDYPGDGFSLAPREGG